MLTRFLPFLIFGKRKKLPAFIEYLGKVLPAAMMGLLVVYCFRDINLTDIPTLIPAIAGSLAVVVLHLVKRNTILSISAGTVVYMILHNLL